MRPFTLGLLSSLTLTLSLACEPARSSATDPDAGEADGGAPAVTLELAAQCTTFSACDSSPLGTWTYRGGCVETGEVWTEVQRAVCETATVSSVSGTVEGSLTVGASQWVRRGTQTLSGTIELPTACLTHGADCGYLQDALSTLLSAQVLCFGSTACQCAVTQIQSLDGTHAVAVSGSTITVEPAASSARTYAFCADTATLRLEETTPQGAGPGQYVLGR